VDPRAAFPQSLTNILPVGCKGDKRTWSPVVSKQCGQWELWPLANTRTVPCLPSRESGSRSLIPTRGVSSHAYCNTLTAVTAVSRSLSGGLSAMTIPRSSIILISYIHTYIHTYLHTYLFCLSIYLPTI